MTTKQQTEESIIQLLHSDDVDDVALGIIIAVRLYGRTWFPTLDPSPEINNMPKNMIYPSRQGKYSTIMMLFQDGEYIFCGYFFEYITKTHSRFALYREHAEHKYEYGE